MFGLKLRKGRPANKHCSNWDGWVISSSRQWAANLPNWLNRSLFPGSIQPRLESVTDSFNLIHGWCDCPNLCPTALGYILLASRCSMHASRACVQPVLYNSHVINIFAQCLPPPKLNSLAAELTAPLTLSYLSPNSPHYSLPYSRGHCHGVSPFFLFFFTSVNWKSRENESRHPHTKWSIGLTLTRPQTGHWRNSFIHVMWTLAWWELGILGFVSRLLILLCLTKIVGLLIIQKKKSKHWMKTTLKNMKPENTSSKNPYEILNGLLLQRNTRWWDKRCFCSGFRLIWYL